MKKLLLIVVLGLLLSGNSFANDNRKCINETGFVSDKFNFSKNIKFEDPENTLKILKKKLDIYLKKVKLIINY